MYFYRCDTIRALPVDSIQQLSLECCFLGTFDENKLKQGQGVYVWMSELNEDGERTEVARYEGNYVDGVRSGVGKFVFPSGTLIWR